MCEELQKVEQQLHGISGLITITDNDLCVVADADWLTVNINLTNANM